MNKKLLFLLSVLMAFSGLAQKVTIPINQVGFNTGSSKVALLSFDRPLAKPLRFSIVEAASGQVAFQTIWVLHKK